MSESLDSATYFETFYQGESPVEGMTFRTVPWDIGGPQRFVVDAERAGRFSGAVLDAGCGLGDNTIYLAERGYRVTGVDFAPTAIHWANKRAAARGVEVDFVVGDAVALPGHVGRFDSVMDSGLIECLEAAQRKEYAATLHRVTRPGARLNIFCVVPHELPVQVPGVFPLSEDELRDVLGGAGWTITDLRPDTHLCNTYATDFFRNVGVEIDTDDTGRALLTSWAVEAERH